MFLSSYGGTAFSTFFLTDCSLLFKLWEEVSTIVKMLQSDWLSYLSIMSSYGGISFSALFSLIRTPGFKPMAIN